MGFEHRQLVLCQRWVVRQNTGRVPSAHWPIPRNRGRMRWPMTSQGFSARTPGKTKCLQPHHKRLLDIHPHLDDVPCCPPKGLQFRSDPCSWLGGLGGRKCCAQPGRSMSLKLRTGFPYSWRVFVMPAGCRVWVSCDKLCSPHGFALRLLGNEHFQPWVTASSWSKRRV